MAAEKNFQDDVLKDLRSYGKYIEVFKIMRTSDDGVPDVFFTTVTTGAIFVELKAPGKKPGPLQEHKISKLNSCGTKAFWCDNWDDWVRIKQRIGLNRELVCR